MSNVTDIKTGLPVVAGVEIAVDELGRFNLNAIHKASGAGQHKRPGKWLDNAQSKELIAELESQSPISGLAQKSLNVVKGTNTPGTFAHELLAISYAGWISPAFQLKVNQVFMDYRTGKLQPTAVPVSLSEALRLAADMAEQIEKQSEKIEKLENFFQQGMTLTAFGKMLNGVNCHEFGNFVMLDLRWLYNESRSGKNRRLRVYHTARDRYLTETSREIGVHGAESLIRYEPKILKKGAQKLYDLYLQGKLPMKKTWDGEYVHLKFEGEAA